MDWQKKFGSRTSFTLWNNGIGAEGAKAVAIALEKNTTLQKLDLMNNGIGAEGAKAVAIALEKNTTLQTLRLTDNGIGAEGAKAVAIALEKNTTLQELDLTRNGIGTEGAKAVAVALEKNATLQKLYLWKNGIGAEGAKAVAIALERNTTLQELNFGLNHIGVEGAKAVAIALEKNTTLQQLVVDDEIVSNGALVESFAKAICRNPGLKISTGYSRDPFPEIIAESQRLKSQAKKEQEEKEKEIQVAKEEELRIFKKEQLQKLEREKETQKQKVKKENENQELTKLPGMLFEARSVALRKIVDYKAKTEIMKKTLTDHHRFLNDLDSNQLWKLFESKDFEQIPKIFKNYEILTSEIQAHVAARTETLESSQNGVLTPLQLTDKIDTRNEHLNSILTFFNGVSQPESGTSCLEALKTEALALDKIFKDKEEKTTLSLEKNNSFAEDFNSLSSNLSVLLKSMDTYRSEFNHSIEKEEKHFENINEIQKKTNDLFLLSLGPTLVSVLDSIKSGRGSFDIDSNRLGDTHKRALDEIVSQVDKEKNFLNTIVNDLLAQQKKFESIISNLNENQFWSSCRSDLLNVLKVLEHLCHYINFKTCQKGTIDSCQCFDCQHAKLQNMVSTINEYTTEKDKVITLKQVLGKNPALAVALQPLIDDAEAGQIAETDFKKCRTDLIPLRATFLNNINNFSPEYLLTKIDVLKLGLGKETTSCNIQGIYNGEWKEGEVYDVLKTLSNNHNGKEVVLVKVKSKIFGNEKTEGKEFCVKRCHTFGTPEKQEVQKRRFYRNCALLDSFDHPHLIKIICVFEESTPSSHNMLSVMTPYYKEGDLETFLRKYPAHIRTLSLCQGLLLDILQALKYLHQRNLVHCDVKLKNIFVSKSQRAVLGDFDDVQDLNFQLTRTVQRGTFEYLAPELSSQGNTNQHLSCASDMYSFGIVVQKIVKGLVMDEHKKKEYDTFVSSLLHVDPNQRLTAKEAIKSSFLYMKIAIGQTAVCGICTEIVLEDSGLPCSKNLHFACKECINDYMNTLTEPTFDSRLRNAKGRIPCFDPTCQSTPRLATDYLNLWSNETFDKYQRAIVRFQEEDTVQQMNKVHEEKLKNALEKNLLELSFRRHKNHIENEILTLKCPRSGHAFIDFEGCSALTCTSCKPVCYFCAYCQVPADTDQKNHQHVASCSLRTDSNRGYGGPAAFDANLDKIKLDRVKNYWKNNVETREILETQREVSDWLSHVHNIYVN